MAKRASAARRRPARTQATRRKKKVGPGFNAVPAYFWLICLYLALIGGGWMSGGGGLGEASGADAAAGAPQTTAEMMRGFLDATLFSVPVVAGDSLYISWTVLFVVLGFICCWVEAFRAMASRGKAYNDIGSILVTIPAIILLIGFEAFQTTAFLVIALVGFGDVILDRLVHRVGPYREYYAV